IGLHNQSLRFEAGVVQSPRVNNRTKSMTAPAAPTTPSKPAARCVGKGAMMLRCSGALLTGLLAVVAVTMGLIVISDSEEAPTQSAGYTIRFPESEAALKEMSDQLQAQAEAGDLSSIETAAGDVAEESVGKPLIGNPAVLPAQPRE
ncbi:MAG TPA: hypothetical protein VEF76_04395, partial [Patescibacteria group bacterium]|nr:hypothetical protein [Patescibacteria group bacterium]